MPCELAVEAASPGRVVGDSVEKRAARLLGGSRGASSRRVVGIDSLGGLLGWPTFLVVTSFLVVTAGPCTYSGAL